MEKHMTAGAIIVTAEEPIRVLLVHHNKFNKWMTPGGHGEHYENPYETAIREVREETGLDIAQYMDKPVMLDAHATSIPVPFRIIEEAIPVQGEKAAHYHIDHIYVVSIPFQEATHDPNESGDIRWVEERELDGLAMFDDCRELLKEIFRNGRVK